MRAVIVLMSVTLAAAGISRHNLRPASAGERDGNCPCLLNTQFARAAAGEDDEKKKPKKTVAGKADVLVKMPKKFAAYLGHNPERSTVSLHIEGETGPSTWKLIPTADIKFHGWWGRLNQFTKGDRVWVWFAIDRNKQPKAIALLADEISEQDMHGWAYTIISIDKQNVTAETGYGKVRKLVLPDNIALLSPPGKDQKLLLQTAGKQIRRVMSAKDLKAARNKQKEHLRNVWGKEGLPGMVQFVHPPSGEMEIMLDHQAMRWGRYLKNGDKITLTASGSDSFKPIKAAVKKVEPWREFTRILLATNSGVDQTELKIGQRINAVVPEPPKAVQESDLPTDIDRPRSKEERLHWFLCSTYCTCKVKGDRCTGMAYTLASCNVNACGMPNKMRKTIGKMIDDGMTDRQIVEQLRKTRGEMLLKQHLLP